MSLDALRYVAEKCRHDRVGGSVKNLLWVVAYLVVKGEKETPSVYLGTLKDMTGDDLRTVQRAREVLCSPEVGELRMQAAEAKRVIYELVKFEVQGELFGLRTPGQDDVRRRDNLARSASLYHDSLSRSITTNCRDTTSSCRDVDEPLSVRTVVGRSDRSTTAWRRPLAQQLQQAHMFLERFVEEFAKHKSGAIYNCDESELKIAQELLEKRPSLLLLAMARLMWTTTRDRKSNSDRTFIATAPDQGIRLLRKKRNYLDQQVRKLGLYPPVEEDASGHIDVDALTAHVSRACARLRQSIADFLMTPFGEQLASIDERLSTLELCDRARAAAELAILDAEMLLAARAAAGDDPQLLADADTELVAYRGRMVDEAYQRANSDVIDRLVREKYRLPILTWEYSRKERTA